LKTSRLLAVSFLVASALTAPASAVTVVKYTMPSKVKAHISGPGGVNATVWMGLGILTFDDHSTKEVFCIDPWHTITLGTFSPVLNYVLGDAHAGLGVNSPGIGTLKEIQYLTNYGVNSNNPFIEWAVQGAIWTKEGFTISEVDPGLLSKIGELAAWTNQVGYSPKGYFSTDNPTRQSFQTAVPEPASWALMIAGFGLVGGSLRRRRMITQVAA
jgi:PEP-CTERM motif